VSVRGAPGVGYEPAGVAAAEIAAAGLHGRGAGRAADRGFKWLALAAGLVVLAVLAGIAISTTQKAWPAFTHEGLSFVTDTTWDPAHDHFGAAALIYGTVVASFIAVLVAVPVSVGIALFTTEVAGRRLRGALTIVMDLLAAIPSVVFGLWGLQFLLPSVKTVYNSIADAVNGIPVLHTVFGHTGSGQSFMTAGLILALMITPIITSVTREVFLTVPRNDKDGALALGATRWEMIRGVVFPHSTGGMVGAVMLGLGRALGETIAVALLIGASVRVTANMFASGEGMASKIARSLNEAEGLHRPALIGLGVVLFLLTVLVNIGARQFVAAFERRAQGLA
jgi:phosphate transport system permease protein